MTMMNNQMNQNGLMNNISWMWIPAWFPAFKRVIRLGNILEKDE